MAYQISVEGYAVRIYWYDEAQGKAEEQEVLAPLSLSRAEKVRTILVSYGIPASRMNTLGFGGMKPVVPHSDLDNRRKSRRVEFNLRKK